MGPMPSEKGKGKSDKVRRRPGRVPTSCQECRRLKLRCDQKVPCETCTKRGCASICPDGSLAAGKGSRMVLASTKELHERIELLCSRIRKLEDGLRTLQSTVSDQDHPLLSEDLLNIKAPTTEVGVASSVPNRAVSTPQSTSSVSTSLTPRLDKNTDEDNFIDAFGTLAIGSKGETMFLGKTARSEYLLHAPIKPSPLTPFVFPRLPKDIINACTYDAEITAPNDDLGRKLFSMLPPLTEAIKLCELYLEHGKYIWCPLPRTELFEQHLSKIYRYESYENLSSFTELALLFVVFALGALFDPAQPSFSVESQEYYLVSRTTLLNLVQPVYNATTSSIMTLVHLGQYLELSDWESTGSSMAWIYMGIASKLSASIALHLNSARWKLDEETSQRRSRVFWQLFTYDTWLSFNFGRHPSLNLAFIDCALPQDSDEFTNKDGQKELGFHSWTWQYARLLHNVMTTAFGGTMPPYSTVLDLDRKIRDFPVPKYLQPNCDPNEQPKPSPELSMQRWIVLSSKEATLLNLHRTYFAQALRDQPHDLLRHRYAPSVMATYRSAWRLIRGLEKPSIKIPNLLSRFSLAWSHALSAAIVVCLFVTRAPSSNLATSCLAELDRVERIFESAAPNSRAALNSLESIKRLRLKGHEAVDQSHSSNLTTFTPAELDRLGGKTHLISERPCPSPPSLSASTNPSPPSDSSAGMSTTPYASMRRDIEPMSMENLHPRIVQDMKAFDGFDFSNYSSQTQSGEFLFDFPPEPSSSYPQVMPDIQYQDASIYGGDLVYQQPVSGYLQNSQRPAAHGFSPGPPVLDATWQNFVEQLGF